MFGCLELEWGKNSVCACVCVCKRTQFYVATGTGRWWLPREGDWTVEIGGKVTLFAGQEQSAPEKTLPTKKVNCKILTLIVIDESRKLIFKGSTLIPQFSTSCGYKTQGRRLSGRSCPWPHVAAGTALSCTVYHRILHIVPCAVQ